MCYSHSRVPPQPAPLGAALFLLGSPRALPPLAGRTVFAFALPRRCPPLRRSCGLPFPLAVSARVLQGCHSGRVGGEGSALGCLVAGSLLAGTKLMISGELSFPGNGGAHAPPNGQNPAAAIASLRFCSVEGELLAAHDIAAPTGATQLVLKIAGGTLPGIPPDQPGVSPGQPETPPGHWGTPASPAPA